MTKLERATRKAIRAWCEAHEHPAKKISRVFPRAYIVARLTINCLVAAVPACDTRKLPIGYDFGSHTVHNFDPYLHIGDWCSVAYVVTETWSGWVAIPAVTMED